MTKFNKGDIVSNTFDSLRNGEVLDPEPNEQGKITVQWPNFGHVNKYGSYERNLALVKAARKFNKGDIVNDTVTSLAGGVVLDPEPTATGHITVKWPTFKHVNPHGIKESDLVLEVPAEAPSITVTYDIKGTVTYGS